MQWIQSGPRSDLQAFPIGIRARAQKFASRKKLKRPSAAFSTSPSVTSVPLLSWRVQLLTLYAVCGQRLNLPSVL